MIDEQLDTEFEQLIRATLEEMIPKAHVAAARAETTGSSAGPTSATVELLGSTGGRQRRPRALAYAAAAMLVVGAGVVGALVLARDTPAAPAEQPPTDVPSALPTTPLRPDLFPIVPDTDSRAGEASAMYGGQLGWSNPENSEALVARTVDGTISDGIKLSVAASSDGSQGATGTAEKRIVAGIEVDVYVEPGSPVLTTVVAAGTPAFSATGLDPIAFLEAAGGFPISGARVVGDGSVTFAISELPAGYEVVVPPARLPLGSISANTRVPDGDNGDGVSVWVEVRSPLVNSATTGDLRAVDINGTEGWARDVGRGSTVSWPVSVTTWAMVGGAPSLDDALALARAVTFADEATWQSRYAVVEPDYSSKDEALAPPVSTLPEPTELIVSRGTVPDDTPDVVPLACGDTPHTDNTVAAPTAAATSEDAFISFLSTDGAPFFKLGYEELFITGTGSYRYERRNNTSDLVTVIYVEPVGDGWAVTRWLSSPC